MAARGSEGAARATEALLCSHGGFTVLLRLPGVAVSGSDAEQLGLSTPVFQEVPLHPAVWRKAGSDAVLLVAAAALAELAGSGERSAVQSLLESASGVVSGGVVYTIQQAQLVLAAAEPCAYLLTLQAPAWR